MMKSPARFLVLMGSLSCAVPNATGGPVQPEQALTEGEEEVVTEAVAPQAVSTETRNPSSPSTVPIVFELTSPESLAAWMERGWVRSHRADRSVLDGNNRSSAFHAIEVEESSDAAD